MKITPETRATLRAKAEAAIRARELSGMIVGGLLTAEDHAGARPAVSDMEVFEALCAMQNAADPATVLALLDALDEAERDVAELNASYDVRHDADMRAIARWRDGHPERDLRWPDHADLSVWLLGRLDEAERGAEAHRARIDDRTPPSFDWTVGGDVATAHPQLASLRIEYDQPDSAYCTLRPDDGAPPVEVTVHAPQGKHPITEATEVFAGLYWSWWRKASGASARARDTLRTIALAAGLPEVARPDEVADGVNALRQRLCRAVGLPEFSQFDEVAQAIDRLRDVEHAAATVLKAAANKYAGSLDDVFATLRRALKVQP